MNEKAKEILKSIKDSKVKPISKWKFIFKDYLMWGFFTLTTLVGALATSVIIFIVKDNDWDIYKYLEKSFLGYFLILMPYFWIIILFILAYVAYLNYRQTRKGYLLNPYWVILGSIFISVMLGWILFDLKIGRQLDQMCAKNIPYYQGMELQKKNLWSNPEKGLLAGEIIDFKDEDNFVIKDLNNQNWNIIGDGVAWKNEINKEIGEEVKIIGVYESKDKFKAKEVRPWSCHCQKCAQSDGNNHRCSTGSKSEGGKNCSK